MSVSKFIAIASFFAVRTSEPATLRGPYRQQCDTGASPVNPWRTNVPHDRYGDNALNDAAPV